MVHHHSVTGEAKDKGATIAGVEKQAVARKEWKDMTTSERATVARLWCQLSSPPPHIRLSQSTRGETPSQL